MAVEQSSSYRLQSSQYLGEISALCLLHLPSHISSLPYLLAGSGSQLVVYDLESRKMVRSFCVFQGIRVHGVLCSLIDCDAVNSELAFKVVVFGERRVKLFCLRIGMNESRVSVDLTLLKLLPKFGNWVLDVSFLKGDGISSHEGRGSYYLAVGCSDNSVHVWDISKCCVILEVQSPERSLLYSMRLWGDHLESLQIASGTIFNEIIIWKVVPHIDASPFKCQVEDNVGHSSSFSNSLQYHHQQYEAVHICKLVGHEGSIFRISWSSNGSNVVSVSDDRSVRVWEVCADIEDSNKPGESVGLVLFGHNARVWDCCIFDSFIVTAGEDCTCRVWGTDGKQLQVLKEHIGRGIWRCLCDPEFLLLITAGFDSAIKVHQLHASLFLGLEGHSDVNNIDGTNLYIVHIPNSSEHVCLMDSKSEYVRCLHFACEDVLYVATNNGYLYHAKLSEIGDVYWTEIARVGEVVPIICMDLLSKPFKQCCGVEDWVALGDGKGNVTIIQVVSDVCAPKVGVALTWSAGPERQLLGTHWSKSLGWGYVFTADPRGTLKLWRLCDQLQSVSHNCAGSLDAFLVAEFMSSFGIRIMCLDASFENEVLLCGDIRGNLVLFPLLKTVLLRTSAAPDVKISALTYFKGAHGISSVTSVTVAGPSPNQIEICSTGADGCICYFEYDRDGQILEFIGMKQVKELSLVRSVCAENNSVNELSICHYASGFSSVDFMIWNLKTEMKVVRIPCGGWRRPHSYYLGDVPELKNCFAYVKDETIYIHRHWVPDVDRKMFPQNLHMQFHGKEMHTLCFIPEDLQPRANGKHNLYSRFSWIATGCENGTVRLTRYTSGIENWLESKLLGEHVGGSAVRSICCVSKIHLISVDVTNLPNASTEKEDNLVLLISVGAKRVLTSWLLRNRKLDNNGEELSQQHRVSGNGISSDMSSSMSFQWLSTDMPPKYSGTNKLTKNVGEIICGLAQNVSTINSTGFGSESPEKGNTQLKSFIGDKCEDDWRYLAVTSFLVKCAGSRLTICFVVVACSNATLVLRALVLPHRLWFDVAFLVPLSSPVLALQHVIIPTSLSSVEEIQVGSLFIAISGATDGSIAFWDLTRSVEGFMRQISVLQVEKLIDCQKRPRTGRGSQGGRQWRSLGSMSKKRAGCGSISVNIGEGTNHNLVNHVTGKGSTNCDSSTTVSSQAINTAFLNVELNADDSSSEISEIRPLHVLKNIHQSGVNCLHVSYVEGCQSSDGRFLYNVLSGGDDQALHCLRFELSPSLTTQECDLVMLNGRTSVIGAGSVNDFVHSSQNHNVNYKIKVLSHYNVPSAHSSAVKGVWTDGSWVFSAGLDQRLRCWCVGEQGELTEFDNVIVSVPEPEALDARVCSRGHYQIAVAGRGMQMVEFST
ncbi:uncharacterized protein LOC107426171 isoform X1 [Ziziphus jujuba]|uniref:Uncharacterized protein LOC107426171 isoform X1 n=2 Tax=Ziziphus jujuba TaxID=326968 RepID=A0ABM4AHT4_ZIZJJ|nr:uncharacterized protein LOC107426171 isoform X1 [Ziziphus jujuba]XP_060676301.1 uncharacterized protein LOC107426171 isoform X1 [Ziziphus jujuba]XP_060676302.1 uncharacterized protein LOC107426171 isoform X1 [Ziziphus jujuba]